MPRKSRDPNAPRRPRGRPPIKPTPEQVERAAELFGLGLTKSEAACILDRSDEWLNRYWHSHFADAYAIGTARAKLEIAEALRKKAKAGDLGSLIWTQKTLHGMTEKVHTVHSDPAGNALPGVQVSIPGIGLYLPPNGREIPAPGQEVPAAFRIVPRPEP